MKTPPNYIMKFTSPNHKYAIEAHKAIITPKYTLSLTNGLLTTRTELSHGVHKCRYTLQAYHQMSAVLTF